MKTLTLIGAVLLSIVFFPGVCQVVAQCYEKRCKDTVKCLRIGMGCFAMSEETCIVSWVKTGGSIGMVCDDDEGHFQLFQCSYCNPECPEHDSEEATSCTCCDEVLDTYPIRKCRSREHTDPIGQI